MNKKRFTDEELERRRQIRIETAKERALIKKQSKNKNKSFKESTAELIPILKIDEKLESEIIKVEKQLLQMSFLDKNYEEVNRKYNALLYRQKIKQESIWDN